MIVILYLALICFWGFGVSERSLRPRNAKQVIYGRCGFGSFLFYQLCTNSSLFNF